MDKPIAKNSAPEEINSIDDLIQEGKERFKSTAMVGILLGPAFPEANLYFSRALDLMNQQGVQKPDMEFDIESNFGCYLAFMHRYEAAIPHFERCVALQPKSVDARKYLAVTYGHVGNSKKSAQQFTERAKLSGVFSISRYVNYVEAALQYLKAA